MAVFGGDLPTLGTKRSRRNRNGHPSGDHAHRNRLSNDGGALAEFKKPLRLGVAGILGGGRQMVSWIHIEDHIRLYLESIENPNWNGIYNAVAPNPVSSKALTLELARQLNGALFVALPVPTFVLKIMLGDRSIEVLKSTTVSAKKLLEAGFHFNSPRSMRLCKTCVKNNRPNYGCWGDKKVEVRFYKSVSTMRFLLQT